MDEVTPDGPTVDRALVDLELPDAPRREAATAALRSVLARAAAVASNTEERYAIETQIGEGGMGTVWTAFDRELKRRVAIKQLSRQTAESLARFAREAQAVARLSHPHIVMVYDVVTDAEVPYIVMEYLEGTTLGDAVRALPASSWRDKLALLLQAGVGLAAAHGAGLVHRDFKPANAMVTEDGVVKVLDFGLVQGGLPSADTPDPKALEGAADGLTQTGAMLGTPAYMAPEQLDGREADVRVDVYAFALSVWEALYGSRPFDERSLSALTDGKRAGPPVQRPDPRIPSPLHRALVRGMAPDPSQRWPTLEPLLDVVRAAARPRRAGRWWVLGGASVVGLAWFSLVEPSARCDAPADERRAAWSSQRGAYEAALVGQLDPEAVGSVLGTLDRHVEAWTDQFASTCAGQGVSADLARLCLHELSAKFPALDRPEEIPRMAAMLSSPRTCEQEELGRIDPRPQGQGAEIEALETWAAELESRIGAGLPVDMTEIQTRVEQARAIGYAPTTARLLRLLVAGDTHEMDGLDVVAVAEEAFMLASQSGADRLASAIAVRLIGLTHRAGRSDDEVQRWVRYALATLDDREDPEDAAVAEAIFVNAYALMLLERGRADEALAEVERVWPEVAEPQDVRLFHVRLRERRASALFNLQRFDEAVEAYREVLRVRAVLGPSPREEAMQRANLAVALHMGGRLEEAVHEFERVLDGIDEAGLPPVTVTTHRINAARAFMEHPPSVERAVDVLTRAKRDAEPRSDNHIFAAYSLAQAHRAAGDPVAGLVAAEEARRLCAVEYGPDSPRTRDATRLRDALRTEAEE